MTTANRVAVLAATSIVGESAPAGVAASVEVGEVGVAALVEVGVAASVEAGVGEVHDIAAEHSIATFHSPPALLQRTRRIR